MTIVASNSLTVSNVNDGTITHTAYAWSADGTDRFTTVYPNLNLLVNSSAKTKDGFFKNFDRVENDYGEVTLKGTNTYTIRDLSDGFFIKPREYKPGDKYTMSMDIMFTSWNLPVGTTLTEFWIGQRYVAGSWAQICFIDLPKNPSQMLNQWIRITQTSTIPPYPDPSVNTQTAFQTKFTGASEGSFTVRIRKPKQEQGSIATPYMQSASEVTTADWPKYRGEYSDLSSEQSTNPSDYTWGPMRGDDGIAGNDGVGVTSTTITYTISTNETTAPATGWTSSVPSLIKGQYLWTKTVWTYTDNSSETGYSVTYISKDGNNGTNGIAGKDGKGIKATTISYASHTNGTIAPTTGYTTTVPSVPAGQFLWTKTVWTYTDNTSETGFSVGKMGDTGPAGSDGNPGKIVSDTEPTTKFKGLAWKYSGAVDMTLGNGTKILAETEYYWNGTAWALYEINAHNINGDNLSVTNGTFKDGKIESVWGSNGVNGTTTIEGSHLQIHSSDSTTNTENTVAIDNRQGYAQVYTDHNTGRAITVQTSFQGFFVSDSTGPYVRVTPNGIKTSSDKSYNSFQIGAGITINLERRGDIVEATLSGSINSPLSSNTKFVVGTIPVGYRPNRLAYIMVHMTSTNNSSHIDVEPNGLCTWWGTSYNAGAPRGNQMWFTDDPLQN